MKQPDYTSKSIDHLGLVSALCQELGIAKFIDNQFPNQSVHRDHRPDLNQVILNLITENQAGIPVYILISREIRL